MKKVLLDYIKTKEDFDRFCNLFLKKEVSPFVKVYDAPGRDGGIDADYTGHYKEKDGTWIFQYKFLDPTRYTTQQARRNFLSTVIGGKRKKGELDKADALQCDHYVLMTNTLLTAGNKRKIEDIKNEKGYAFSLTCWDAEDLITMTDEFPYLLNSFRDPHLPVFLSRQDMFRNQIAGQNKLLRYDDYETFGREDEISQFQTFVQARNKRLLMVYGSGGIGKTKLAIEFAKIVEQEHTNYEPLFVQMADDSFESALADIPPNRNYIFFIDDAHDFIDHLGGIKILLNSPGYSKSKAVLITRKPFKAFLEGSFRTVLSDNAVDELEIGKLSLEKTKEFIRAYTRIPDGTLLTGLARIARDTPLIAVMVIGLLNKGVELRNLTKDELVELAFESYLNDIFSEHLPKFGKRHRKLLDWLSGIASIDVEDARVRDKLAELLKVETYEIEQSLDDLIACGLLVQYGRKQRIFPDPLSDYILRKACFLSSGRPSSFHKSLLIEFLPLLPVKVVINLARVENIAGEKSLLDEHVAFLKIQVKEGDNATREDILEQMEGISYFRADNAIEIFNIILDNPNSVDVKKGLFTLTHQKLVRKIANQTSKTGHTLLGFRQTLSLIQKLLLMKDLNLPRVDSPEALLTRAIGFQSNKSFVFQKEALEVFEAWQKEDKPELHLALLHALDSLLVLEFTEIVNEGRGLAISSQNLNYTPELLEFRVRAISLVRYCLRRSQRSAVRVKAIECIRGALHHIQNYIWNGMAKDNPTILQNEQATLFEILKNQISEESDVTVLNAIDECLNNYTNEYSDDFSKEKATEVLEKFRVRQNYDRYLLYRQFFGKSQDGYRSPEELQEFVKRYVKKYTPTQLSKLMHECLDLAEKGWEYGSVTSFFQIIGELHPTYGDDLLDHIAAWQIDESHYASGLLVGLRHFDKDKAQKAVHRLLNRDNIFAKRIIAKSYRWGSEKQSFNQKDLQILSQLSKIPDELLRRYVTGSLLNFYSVDANIVLEILVRLSTDPSPSVVSGVLSTLSSKEFKCSQQEHLGKYKQVMQNYLHLSHLSPNAEPVLHTIFMHDPIWVIAFFEDRIAYKARKVKDVETISDDIHKFFEYRPVPYHFQELFKDVNWNDKKMLKTLRRVRNWVRMPSKDSMISTNLRIEAPGLLVSMVGENNTIKLDIKINKAMKTLLEEWIDSGDLELMREAAYLMRDFDPDDVFYSLAESILIKSEEDPDIQDNITIAIRAGVYSRTHGEPSFQLEKRIADLKALRQRTQSLIVSKYANRLIEITEQEIQQQLQEDEEFLEGEEW